MKFKFTLLRRRRVCDMADEQNDYYDKFDEEDSKVGSIWKYKRAEGYTVRCTHYLCKKEFKEFFPTRIAAEKALIAHYNARRVKILDYTNGPNDTVILLDGKGKPSENCKPVYLSFKPQRIYRNSRREIIRPHPDAEVHQHFN